MAGRPKRNSFSIYRRASETNMEGEEESASTSTAPSKSTKKQTKNKSLAAKDTKIKNLSMDESMDIHEANKEVKTEINIPIKKKIKKSIKDNDDKLLEKTLEGDTATSVNKPAEEIPKPVKQRIAKESEEAPVLPELVELKSDDGISSKQKSKDSIKTIPTKPNPEEVKDKKNLTPISDSKKKVTAARKSRRSIKSDESQSNPDIKKISEVQVPLVSNEETGETIDEIAKELQSELKSAATDDGSNKETVISKRSGRRSTKNKKDDEDFNSVKNSSTPSDFFKQPKNIKRLKKSSVTSGNSSPKPFEESENLSEVDLFRNSEEEGEGESREYEEISIKPGELTITSPKTSDEDSDKEKSTRSNRSAKMKSVRKSTPSISKSKKLRKSNVKNESAELNSSNNNNESTMKISKKSDLKLKAESSSDESGPSDKKSEITLLDVICFTAPNVSDLSDSSKSSEVNVIKNISEKTNYKALGKKPTIGFIGLHGNRRFVASKLNDAGFQSLIHVGDEYGFKDFKSKHETTDMDYLLNKSQFIICCVNYNKFDVIYKYLKLNSNKLKGKVYIDFARFHRDQMTEMSDLIQASEALYLEFRVLLQAKNSNPNGNTILVSGDKEALDKSMSLLEVLGEKLHYVGTQRTKASTISLLMNAHFYCIKIYLLNRLKDVIIPVENVQLDMLNCLCKAMSAFPKVLSENFVKEAFSNCKSTKQIVQSIEDKNSNICDVINDLYLVEMMEDVSLPTIRAARNFLVALLKSNERYITNFNDFFKNEVSCLELNSWIT